MNPALNIDAFLVVVVVVVVDFFFFFRIRCLFHGFGSDGVRGEGGKVVILKLVLKECF